jgi:hypothetical protein
MLKQLTTKPLYKMEFNLVSVKSALLSFFSAKREKSIAAGLD